MKKTPFQNQSKAQLSLKEDFTHIKTLFEQQRYEESLDLCLQITRTHPASSAAWYNAAYNCVKLRRWQDVIGYAQTSLARGGKDLGIYDLLSYAHGELKQWDQMRRYGLQALKIRDQYFNKEPCIPLSDFPRMPPLPSVQTRAHNVIAFSLFGSDPKYCETAVLNVMEQPGVYPHWICRFYVDGSVPANIIDRLQKGGAQVVHVEGSAAQWPGVMWRLLALNDPQAHRVLFRDADSLISRREAAAVEQWLTSGKRFHMMRDHSSHVELILAGMWGVVAGSLPPLEKLLERFMSAPLTERTFADQYFLRRYVWPYARTSLMQHDSVFGFMDAVEFPPECPPQIIMNTTLFVGANEGDIMITVKADFPDGSKVNWGLFKNENHNTGQTRERLICAYPAIVHDSAINIHIPLRYLLWLEQKTAHIRVAENNNRQAA